PLISRLRPLACAAASPPSPPHRRARPPFPPRRASDLSLSPSTERRALLRQAQLRRAGRPSAVTAPGVPQFGRDRDLLLPCGLMRVGRVLGTAVGVPGLLVELQPAVVAVTGVDGPVATGFTLGEREIGRVHV